MGTLFSIAAALADIGTRLERTMAQTGNAIEASALRVRDVPAALQRRAEPLA